MGLVRISIRGFRTLTLTSRLTLTLTLTCVGGQFPQVLQVAEGSILFCRTCVGRQLLDVLEVALLVLRADGAVITRRRVRVPLTTVGSNRMLITQ